jgi:hypothetical protein
MEPSDAPAAPTFYATLPPFRDFAEVADPDRYVDAPDDWLLVLADIRGSTAAARAGRYKDVNLIGAACITAALNVTAGLDLPYAFGGDGAVVLIPPASKAAVARALAGTRQLAVGQFGLELRAGMVPVHELKARGRRVLVGKYELSSGNHLAMFAGGGVELAERLIKQADPAAYELEVEGEPGPPDLHGLSCRWEPHRARRGRMLTLLVKSLGAEDQRHYARIIRAISEIVGADGEAAQPVLPADQPFVWPSPGLRAEAMLSGTGLRALRRWLRLAPEALLQLVAERFGLRIGAYDPPAYREELRRNSDHRKLADTLHMVLDCSGEEAAAIEADLAARHARGEIVYGLHLADRALMTCLVFSLAESRHVHFIDGADGGYALAALQLKEQLLAAAAREAPAGKVVLEGQRGS